MAFCKNDRLRVSGDTSRWIRFERRGLDQAGERENWPAKIGPMRQSSMDSDEELADARGLGKSEPHMTLEEDGEQEGGAANSFG